MCVCRYDTFVFGVASYNRVLRIHMYKNVCSCAGACSVSVCVGVCVQVRWAHRVRRCCRALLTAAGNQSTLSVYSPTRRFLNDLP